MSKGRQTERRSAPTGDWSKLFTAIRLVTQHGDAASIPKVSEIWGPAED